MLQAITEKGVDVDCEVVPAAQKESRAHHHVALVLSRILAKQKPDAKATFFRHGDVENKDIGRNQR